MQYRPEIDGLRAVAVLPVILFHGGFDIFSGGFVGVDVFFVISGYLITTLLIEDIEQGKFSLLSFYERRARRILPALFFVMLCCLPFAWLWMMPEDLRDFAQSVLAVSVFASNFLFWRETNYFTVNAEEKPLLHTWSLAVEEQYYIVFPILLVLLWRFGRSPAFWVIFLIAVISLALSEWGWRNKPSANFYLAPTRAWELFAGSLAAFIVTKHGIRGNNWLALAGLGAIGFSIFAFDHTTPFPSIYTLVPVLGVVLLILFATGETIAARILSTRVLVGIGLVSYSAYLWHQPLFAFARIRSFFEPGLALMSGLAVLSIILAAVTWKLVEQPFRGKNAPLLPKRAQIFSASGAGILLFLAIGVAGHQAGGFPGRISSEALAMAEVTDGDTSGCMNRPRPRDAADGKDCRIGASSVVPDIAIIGDSHASMISGALTDSLLEQERSAAIYAYGWCAPLIHFATNTSPKNNCLREVKAAFEQVLRRDELDTVILHAEWANYTTGYRPHADRDTAAYLFSPSWAFDWTSARVEDNAASFEAALDHALQALRDANKRIILVLSVPEYTFDVPVTMAKFARFGRHASEVPRLSKDAYLQRNAAVLEVVNRLKQKHDFDVVDPSTAFCREDLCDIIDPSGASLYEDSNHITYEGAQRVVPALLDVLE